MVCEVAKKGPQTYGQVLFSEQSGKRSETVGAEVTEQVQARKKIEESQQRFLSLANSVTQLAWIADGAGWIYWYNNRWYDYTGTTLEEMAGWGW